MSTTHNLTYNHLLNHSKDHSTVGLCLSEFIDNSISSYLESHGDSNNIDNIDGCVIEIFLDRRDENNIKLEISDNAGGMTEAKLNEAVLEYHNFDQKNSSDFNQYGIGMKFAIFWFGRNGKIWTKKKNEIEYFINYKANVKRGNEIVATSVEKSKDNKIDNVCGTTILIENVYSDSTLNRITYLTRDKYKEETINTLYYRFIQYIKKGLIIKFTYADNQSIDRLPKEKLEKSCSQEFDVMNSKSFHIARFLKLDNSRKVSKNDMKTEEAFHEMLEKNMSALAKKNSKFQNEYEIWLHKIKFGKELIIDDKIILNGEDLPVKFCFLCAPDQKFCGIAIKHKNRYIKHVPNAKGSIGHILGTQPFTKNIRFEDGKYKWLYGEVDLTKKCYNVSPDKNKGSMIWGAELEDEWEKAFEKLIKDKYVPFIDTILVPLKNKKTEVKKQSFSEVNKSNRRLYESWEKIKDNDDVLTNSNMDENGKLTISLDDENEFGKIYDIGEVKIIVQRDPKLEKFFSFFEKEKNVYWFQYNPYLKIFDKEYSELYIIKLISLLQIMHNGKLKTDDSIVDIINNIIVTDK